MKMKLDWTHPQIHQVADTFWRVWNENGEPHKHGFYESTWMAIDAALAELDKETAQQDKRHE